MASNKQCFIGKSIVQTQCLCYITEVLHSMSIIYQIMKVKACRTVLLSATKSFYKHQYNVLWEMLPLNSQTQYLFLAFCLFYLFRLLYLEINIICLSLSFVFSISASRYHLTTISASGFLVIPFLKFDSELSICVIHAQLIDSTIGILANQRKMLNILIHS